MRDGDRQHRVTIYGLTSYRRYPDLRCPAPWPLDDRLIRLAEFVDAFNEPLTIDENAIIGTSVARFAEDGVTFVVGARIEFAGWDAYR